MWARPWRFPPPAAPGHPPSPVAAADRRDIKAARAGGPKLKALHLTCGKRRGRENTCPTSIQLHVMEELLELFGIDNVFHQQVPPTLDMQTETAMAISCHALMGFTPPKIKVARVAPGP